jgi:hypothetical protein
VSRSAAPATGTCFRDAARAAAELEDAGATLVHGHVEGINPIENHAWVELDSGHILEVTLGDGVVFDPDEVNPDVLRYVPHMRFEPSDAMILMIRTGNWGPWTNEEITSLMRRARSGPSRGKRRL